MDEVAGLLELPFPLVESPEDWSVNRLALDRRRRSLKSLKKGMIATGNGRADQVRAWPNVVRSISTDLECCRYN